MGLLYLELWLLLKFAARKCCVWQSTPSNIRNTRAEHHPAYHHEHHASNHYRTEHAGTYCTDT